MSTKNPYGDDAGTRVGRPSTPDRKNRIGAGAEAATGIHSDQDDQADGTTDGTRERPGSEPLEHRDREHDPGYGGKGGAPKSSSEER